MADRRARSRVLAGLSELPRAFGEDRDSDAADDENAPVVAAFEQGRLEGLEAGTAQTTATLRAECDALRKAISETVKTLVDLRTRETHEHRRAMFELALSAASRMLRDKVEQGDPVASRALQEALSALPESGPVEARLHPEDIESIRGDLAREIDDGSVVLTADETIGRGGCIVSSDAGTVDATVETAAAVVEETARGTDAP